MKDEILSRGGESLKKIEDLKMEDDPEDHRQTTYQNGRGPGTNGTFDLVKKKRLRGGGEYWNGLSGTEQEKPLKATRKNVVKTGTRHGGRRKELTMKGVGGELNLYRCS